MTEEHLSEAKVERNKVTVTRRPQHADFCGWDPATFSTTVQRKKKAEDEVVQGIVLSVLHLAECLPQEPRAVLKTCTEFLR